MIKDTGCGEHGQMLYNGSNNKKNCFFLFFFYNVLAEKITKK